MWIFQNTVAQAMAASNVDGTLSFNKVSQCENQVPQQQMVAVWRESENFNL